MILKYSLHTAEFHLKHLNMETYMYYRKGYMTTSFTFTFVGYGYAGVPKTSRRCEGRQVHFRVVIL